MHRTRIVILVFAAAVMLLIGVAAVTAYVGVRDAFARDFQRRLTDLAELAASQVGAEDLADMRIGGSESTGYLAIQVQLDGIRAGTDLYDLTIVGTDRHLLYSSRDPEGGFGEVARADSMPGAVLDSALAGRVAATASYWMEGLETRAVLAPVRDGDQVSAVLVAEAHPQWQGELARLRRRLALVALAGMVAVGLLAALLVRQLGAQLALERRLSRSENLAAMGRLTATLAHEIKNPLAIIRGSARRLGKLEPDAGRMADSVVEEVDRLGRTVNRYLQFARGESGGGGQGDAATTLKATLELLEGEASARRCRLVATLDPGPQPVPLDGESLKQVWLNLVLNALEALPEGGSVAAHVAREGQWVCVTIADDGPGIPADVLGRLGEPFHTTKVQGSGLGLFLSRRLVEGAGGRLEAHNGPGRGARVRVRLPLGASPGGPAGR